MGRYLIRVLPLRNQITVGGSPRPVRVLALVVVLAMVFPASASAIESSMSKGPFNPEAYAISPPRYDFDAEKIAVHPGDVKTFSFYVQNRFNHPIDVDITLSDIESSKNPVEVLRVVRHGQYGARSWMSIEQPHLHLISGQKVTQTATVQVPRDVGGGSYYAAITASAKHNSVQDNGGSGAIKTVSVLNTSVFLTIAGSARISGHIASAEAPSFQFNGTGSTVPIYVIWKNTGNVTDAVSGHAIVKSIFGNTVFGAKFQSASVLRGGERQFDTTWRDTPWIGLFHPTIKFIGRNNEPQTESLGWVVVLPPWYYIAGLAIALLIPVVRWYRSRRAWQLYLMDEDEDEDEDWEEAY